MPRSVWYGVPPRPDPHLLRRRGPARDRRQLGYLPLRPRQHLRQHRGVTSAQRVLGDTMLAAALLGRLLHRFLVMDRHHRGWTLPFLGVDPFPTILNSNGSGSAAQKATR